MRIFIFIITLVIGISAYGLMYSQLLTEGDLEFQVLDNAQGAALGSAVDDEWKWDSYNQWQCFSISKLDYHCAEYNDDTLVPSLSVEREHEILHFDLHVEDRLDCEQTLNQWRELTAGRKEVCIFAAQMPDIDMGFDGGKTQSLWYISGLKGVGGYWDLASASHPKELFQEDSH